MGSAPADEKRIEVEDFWTARDGKGRKVVIGLGLDGIRYVLVVVPSHSD